MPVCRRQVRAETPPRAHQYSRTAAEARVTATKVTRAWGARDMAPPVPATQVIDEEEAAFTADARMSVVAQSCATAFCPPPEQENARHDNGVTQASVAVVVQAVDAVEPTAGHVDGIAVPVPVQQPAPLARGIRHSSVQRARTCRGKSTVSREKQMEECVSECV